MRSYDLLKEIADKSNGHENRKRISVLTFQAIIGPNSSQFGDKQTVTWSLAGEDHMVGQVTKSGQPAGLGAVGGGRPCWGHAACAGPSHPCLSNKPSGWQRRRRRHGRHPGENLI